MSNATIRALFCAFVIASSYTTDSPVLVAIKSLVFFVVIACGVARLPVDTGSGAPSILYNLRYAILYLVFAALFAPFSLDLEITVRRLAQTAVQFIALYFLARLYAFRYARPVLALARHTMEAGVVFVALAVLSMAIDGSVNRFSPTFGASIHPTDMSYFFVFALGFAAIERTFATPEDMRSTAAIRMVLFVLGIPIFLLLYTRAALIALLIGLALIAVSRMRQISPAQVLMRVGFFLAGIIATVLLSDRLFAFLSRGQTEEDFISMTGRTSLWSTFLDEGSWTSFFVGNGFANPIASGSIHIGAGDLRSVHNMYLEAYGAVGIFGLLLTVLLFVTPLVRNWRPCFAGHPEATIISFSTLAFLIEGFTTSMWGSYMTGAAEIMLLLVALQHGRRAPEVMPSAPAPEALPAGR